MKAWICSLVVMFIIVFCGIVFCLNIISHLNPTYQVITAENRTVVTLTQMIFIGDNLPLFALICATATVMCLFVFFYYEGVTNEE